MTAKATYVFIAFSGLWACGTGSVGAGTVSCRNDSQCLAGVCRNRLCVTLLMNTELPAISGTGVDGQQLTATPGTWNDATTSTLAIQWQRCSNRGLDCADIVDATASVYVLTPAEVGTTVRAEVTATNAAGSATAISALTAVIAAAGPTNIALPTISGSIVDGQPLEVSTGIWTGTPTVMFAYQWRRCDAAGANCTDISNATFPRYTLVSADVAGTVEAVVVAGNAGASLAAVSAPTGVIEGVSNTALPEIYGNCVDGETLTATPGTWAAAPTNSLAYQWRRCDLADLNCEDIAGANNAAYTTVPADVGYALAVVVTASNVVGSMAVTSLPTVIVAPSPPFNIILPTIRGLAVNGQTLAMTTGIWAGTPLFFFERRWQRCDSLGSNCNDIPSATTASYLLAAADEGSTIRAVVTAINAGGSIPVQSAPTVAVAVGPPVPTAPPTIFGTTLVNSRLTAHPGTWVGAPTITFGYQWRRCLAAGVDCVDIGSETGTSYLLAGADAGHTIRVVVTATNGHGSTPATSMCAAVLGSLACNSAVDLGGMPTPVVGANPRSMAVGKFGTSGHLDLAVANYGDNTVSVLLGVGNGTFATKVDYATGASPSAVATGDFNGDGYVDLAVANSGENTVSIFLGNGNGSFSAKADFATRAGPSSLAIGDFNLDTKLDIVITNYVTNSVSVFLGNGDGTFAAETAYLAGLGPDGVAVADLDGDGLLDVLVVSYGANAMNAFLGHGDGTFSLVSTSMTDWGPYATATGDFDGDGKLDAVIANIGTSTVSLFLGNGDGTFLPRVDYPAGSGPSSVTTADLNSDGHLDLVIVNAVDSTASVLMGHGDGIFAARVDYAAGTRPVAIVVGDLNADAVPDLVVANYDAQNVSVFIGIGDGTFDAKHDYSTDEKPDVIVAVDFNGDGNSDLAVANYNANSVSVLLGNGDGSFTAKVDYATGAGPYAMAAGDFNGDGRPDLAVANYTANSVSVLLGNGDGSLATKADYATGTGPTSVAVGYLNTDSNLDLAVVDYVSRKVSVFLGNGDGTFIPKADYSPGTRPPIAVAVTDLDKNGKNDLVVGNFLGVSVLLGDGSGAFNTKVVYPTLALAPYAVAVGDFNKDGNADVVVVCSGGAAMVLLGNGDGTLAPAVSYATTPNSCTGPCDDLLSMTGASAHGVVIGDFNSDGNPDLAVPNCGCDTVSLLAGYGDGTFAAPIEFPRGIQPRALATADLNGDGRPDLAVANYGARTISVLLNRCVP